MPGLGVALHCSNNLLSAEVNISFWTIYSLISVLMRMFSEYLVLTLDLSRITSGSFDFGLWYLCLQLCLTVDNIIKKKKATKWNNYSIQSNSIRVIYIILLLLLYLPFYDKFKRHCRFNWSWCALEQVCCRQNGWCNWKRQTTRFQLGATHKWNKIWTEIQHCAYWES